MKSRLALFALFVILSAMEVSAQETLSADDYLHWSPQQTESIGKSTYHDGKVGSRVLLFSLGVDTRLLKTERSQNYKLRATWFTPEVIRASARWAQLRSRLTDKETQSLVSEAENAGETIVMVEIDPNEGSGGIPPDWEAFLQPKGTTAITDAVRGVERTELRKLRALQGIMQRNYDYDRFWVVFPLVREDGTPIAAPGQNELELVVRIYNREGAVSWVVPSSIRTRTEALMSSEKKSVSSVTPR